MATKKSLRYINRELSWLEFNQRVLDEARNPAVPVLERLKFLAITAANLDEFFMVRVGSLCMLAERGVTTRDTAGLTPVQQLELIAARVHRMCEDQYRTFLNEIEPELAKRGIERVSAANLSDLQTVHLEQFFRQYVAPVITPMAVSLRTRFPLLRNQGLYLGVRLKPTNGRRSPRFAIIPFGTVLERLIVLPADKGRHYILLEDLVKLFATKFFPGEEIAECIAFRVTRNAGMMVNEDGASDLLAEMQEILDARKTSNCVRLEIGQEASKTLTAFLAKSLGIGEQGIYRIAGPMDLSAFMELTTMDGFEELKYEEWPPQASPLVDPTKPMFELLSQQDILLSHPYDSFTPVLRLIEEAAIDPNVLAIKQTLYRTSRDSPIIAALRRAAQNGKYVTVILELKARFDEARNIEWAKKLEQEGAQVIYGVKGLKTHSKVCIIVRRQPGGIVRYMHFGTGNYNERTARLYSDISYMTCDEALGTDASAFFNAISGYSALVRYQKLESAPSGLRERLLEAINGEAERRRQGQQALIMAKMNSLVDRKLIDALYDASKAGVTILLNVRGICCLRPGIRGWSENITVVSIVDRFLEHSRIFYFLHGGEEQIYISSADWMPRNLDRRIELLVPVEDVASRNQLKATLEVYFADTVKARRLLPDGRYEPVCTGSDLAPVRSQETLWQRACDRVAQARQTRRTVFEPHRPPEAER